VPLPAAMIAMAMRGEWEEDFDALFAFAMLSQYTRTRG
jgi:hypothetical protein